MFATMAKRLIQGYLVGMANIIPGVSGGTLALVLGIYPRLLKALGNIDAEAFRSVLQALTLRPGWRSGLQQTLQRVDAVFLALLGFGAVAAVFSLSRLMTYLLHQHLTLTYAFFFGLIMASIIFPYRMVRRFGIVELGVWLTAVVLAVALPLSVDNERAMERATQQVAMQTGQQAVNMHAPEPESDGTSTSAVTLRMPEFGTAAHIFAGAALAIAAMILPGVSGSFILLLMGVYFDLLRAVDERDLVLIVIFMVGGMFGLLVLVRVVNACLRRRFDATMSAMIGLMCGSLWSLWPFKRYAIIADELFILGNRLPAQGAEIGAAIAVFVLAVALIFFFLRWERTQKVA